MTPDPKISVRLQLCGGPTFPLILGNRTATMPKIVQFAPFQSAVEAPFWHALAKKKLDIFQLSDDEQAIIGFYTSGQSVRDSTTGRSVEIPPRLSISNESLEFSPHEALQKYVFVCVLLFLIVLCVPERTSTFLQFASQQLSSSGKFEEHKYN
jgi:Ubiquitin-like modifier-activating enzyme ATG7 N-terminus